MFSAQAQAKCRFTLVLGSSELLNCSHWTYPLVPSTSGVFLACLLFLAAALKLALCIRLYLCQLSVYKVHAPTPLLFPSLSYST